MSKTIIITGAGTGLGKGTALSLAKAGYNVIATVESWPQVTELKQDAIDAGTTLMIEKLEYANAPDQETVLRKHGEAADSVLLNAAIGETGPAAEIPLKRYREVFEIKVF